MNYNDMFMRVHGKGYLATCECAECGEMQTWHRWTSKECWVDGFPPAQTLTGEPCASCGGKLDPSTFFTSRRDNWYAGRWTTPTVEVVSPWLYNTTRRNLERALLKQARQQ